jgi:hypothetical protein
MSRTLIFVSLLALAVATPLAAQRNAEPFEQWQQSTLLGSAEQNKVDRVSLDGHLPGGTTGTKAF